MSLRKDSWQYGTVIRGVNSVNAGHWAIVICEGDLDGTPNPGKIACLCWEEGRPGPYLGAVKAKWIGDSWEIVWQP